MKDIKKQWKDICDEYLQMFADKHELELDDIDEYNWIGGDPGTIATPSDYFISMEDIRYDIDNDIPEDVFFKWYDYSLELHELDLNNVNYSSYVKGARPYDNNDIERIKSLKKKVMEAQDILEYTIKNLKSK